MLVLGANFYATIVGAHLAACALPFSFCSRHLCVQTDVCVGNMALLVSNLNATAVRHQQKAELMQDSMRYLNVSSRVQARVQA